MAAAAVLASALMAASADAATPSAYVYATSWSQTVRQYAADDAGVLTALTPPDVGAGLTSTAAAASPDRRSLYVVNQTSASVSQFDIGGDGTLTAKTPNSVATGRSPIAIAVAPDGQHAYVVNQGDRTVSTYTVDSTGALTLSSSVATGASPLQIALSPDGSSAYVTNLSGGTVSQYDVSAAGALTPKDPATVAAGSQPAGIAVSSDGGSAYVTNQVASGTVTQLSVDPETGGLEPKQPLTVAAGTQPRGVLTAGNRVYVTNVGSSTISQYTADGDGALSELAPAIVTPTNPFGLALSPDGSSLYVAAYTSGSVGQYDVAADGALSVKAAPAPAGFRPQAVVAVKPRDEQAPTIDLRTPAEGAQFALGATVEADYSCADEGGSGLASCTGDVADGAPLDTSTPGPHAFTVVARDGEGHETSLTHGYSVTPDEQAPTVDLRTPAEGAQYQLGADVAADYSCADEGGSGLASCTGDVADGAPLDTATAGPHSFTVVAHDSAGHETTVTHAYSVVEPVLTFQGFRGEIQDGSLVWAGDALPIIFSLGGFHGLDVLADGSPSSVKVDCDDVGQPTGGWAAKSEGDRGLRFSQWTGNYVFKWQTDRRWAGTCRTFVLTLADGSPQRLTVRFRSSWSWHRHR